MPEVRRTVIVQVRRTVIVHVRLIMNVRLIVTMHVRLIVHVRVSDLKCMSDSQCMSILTEVDTGLLMLLLLAWQVRMEWRSSRPRSLSSKVFTVLWGSLFS